MILIFLGLGKRLPHLFVKDTKKIQSWLINGAFAVLAAVSLYYAFAGKDLQALGAELKNADYIWVIPVLCSSLLGSSARALRWQLLLEPVAHKPSFGQSFFALMYGYFVNIGTPRVGELSRCISLQETAKIPFAKSFGTVFTERAVDLVCLLLCVALAFGLQAAFLGDFFNIHIFTPINDKTGGKAVYIFTGLVVAGIIGLVTLLFIARRLKKLNAANKLVLFIRGIIEGLVSIFSLKKPLLFLLYTALIWFSYFLTSYLWFFAFDATQNLTVAAAFTVMAVGAIAKSLPIQAGGAGLYHFLVGQLLIMYSINGVNTLAYATLNHGTQLVYNTVLGIIALIWLFTSKRSGIKS
ncbi:MAG: flippase-like domain-containing protein [Bacteroidetes bacterium]|nr:MAG: flippase-like domain-containing protein [Bacteroidota bacterium]